MKGKKRWSYRLKVAETNHTIFSKNSKKGNLSRHMRPAITLKPKPDMDIMIKENYRPTPLINIDENSKNNNNLSR